MQKACLRTCFVNALAVAWDSPNPRHTSPLAKVQQGVRKIAIPIYYMNLHGINVLHIMQDMLARAEKMQMEGLPIASFGLSQIICPKLDYSKSS